MSLLILMVVTAGGCINTPHGTATPSNPDRTGTTSSIENVNETPSLEENDTVEPQNAPLPRGIFGSKSQPGELNSPETPIKQIIQQLGKKYNVSETQTEILTPPDYLAGFTGTANGTEFGIFVYPNTSSAEKAVEYLEEKLEEMGFKQWESRVLWAGNGELYSVYSQYRAYFYAVTVVRMETNGEPTEDDFKRMSEFFWNTVLIGPGPDKILGLFLGLRVSGEGWTESEGIRFSGYLQKKEGEIEGENVRAVFLVYRPGEGREVYGQLKEAFFKNGWIEREFVNTYMRNPAGSLIASDFLEAANSSAYIELANVAGLERVTLLLGDKGAVKRVVGKLWNLEPYLAPTKVHSQQRAPKLPAFTFRPLGDRTPAATVLKMILYGLKKDFNITTDFVDIPDVPALEWYTGRANGSEFMLLLYPNVTAYFRAKEELERKLAEDGWGRTDSGGDPYYAGFERGNDVLMVYAQYRSGYYVAVVVKEQKGMDSGLFWHLVGTGGNTPELLLSVGDLKGKIKAENWTEKEGIRFEGYVYGVEGRIVSPVGMPRAIVLFYPGSLGREVYLQLKKALLDNGWVEREYLGHSARGKMRTPITSDLFEANGKAVYIEVAKYGDLDVLVLIYREKAEVKEGARELWR
ncbi:hypothetical protein A3L11_10660 [Thermococcus siculi]|uniref:Uncharacterized protein n=1 Tax=Thermococcus siculi TaxID=72803 RepID=A0A2Z2MMS2_9EURY|nr:hypothetical protein [Thermococcus siculi]ASJ09669.1 hypothetical protein A3L11_10660 [Thermococcus siculi]